MTRALPSPAGPPRGRHEEASLAEFPSAVAAASFTAELAGPWVSPLGSLAGLASLATTGSFASFGSFVSLGSTAAWAAALDFGAAAAEEACLAVELTRLDFSLAGLLATESLTAVFSALSEEGLTSSVLV